MSLRPEERCNKAVRDRGSAFYRTHQCYRRAVKDGMCAIHHPDAVRERDEQRDARRRAEIAAVYRKYVAEEIGKIVLDTLYLEGKLGAVDWGKIRGATLLARYNKQGKKRNG